MLSLSQDIIHTRIQPLLFLEDIGHLKQVSFGCNTLYDAEHMCSMSCACLTYTYSKLAKNYYTCTKALVHFASKKDKKTREKDEKRFEYLWQYHKSVRDKHVATVLDSSIFTIQDCMCVYKKYSSKKKICTHILSEGARWLSLGKADNAGVLFSSGTMHLNDLLNIRFTKKKSMSLDWYLEHIFYHACGLNNVDVIQVICGDSVEARFFEYMMRNASSDLVLNLIGKKIIPITTFDRLGRSVLHYAVWFGFADVIRIVLAEQHAYVNCIDNEGMTLLHYATVNLQYNVVKALLENKEINVCFIDKYGNTAFDYVRSYIFDSSVIKKRKKKIRVLLRPYVEAVKSNKQLTHYSYQPLQ